MSVNRTIKIIAAITCIAFLWQDVVWAGGSDFLRQRQIYVENVSEVASNANGSIPIKAVIEFLKSSTVILVVIFSVFDAAILRGLSGIDIGKDFGPFISLFGGQLGLLALSVIRQIGFNRAQDEVLVNTLLNAAPDDPGITTQNGNGQTASNECNVYYKYLPLDNDTFTTMISPIFDFTDEQLAALQNMISKAEAGDNNKFYVLYSENPASGGRTVFEGTACVKISEGMWNVSIQKSSNAAQATRRLPEEFLTEEIAKWNPGVVIFQKEFIDEATAKLSMPNHIPAFHTRRIEGIKGKARQAFGLDAEDEHRVIYERARFTLIDIVTLWAAAQKNWRRYNMGIIYSTLRNAAMGIVGGLTWGKITDYADDDIDVMGKFNFWLAYISPMLTMAVYQPVNDWLSRNIKLRRDRRTMNLIKDLVTGKIPLKWKAMASNLRVVERFLSVMLLNPAMFFIYRSLYLMLFPGFMLAGAFGSGLFLSIASPGLYLILLFIWWISFNGLTIFTNQTLGETFAGDLLHSESAKSKGYSAVFPVISAFSDNRWMTMLQLLSFAIGDGLIKLCFIGGTANLGLLNYFVPAVVLLSLAAFINELTLPALARDYNAFLIINTQAAHIPERGLNGLDGSSHIVYAYGPGAKPKMWLDIKPKDPELCNVKPIFSKNKNSWLPWIEEMRAQIGYSEGMPLVKPRRINWPFLNSVDFEYAIDKNKGIARTITLKKRFGKIIYGEDFVVVKIEDGNYEVIFYPQEHDKKRAVPESEILPQRSTRQKGHKRFWLFITGLFIFFAPTKSVLPANQHDRQPNNALTATLVQEEQGLSMLKIMLNALGIDAETIEEIIEKYQAPEPTEIQEAKQWMRKEMFITKLEREDVKVVVAGGFSGDFIIIEDFRLIIINENTLSEDEALRNETLKLSIIYTTAHYGIRTAPLLEENTAWALYLDAAKKLGFDRPEELRLSEESKRKVKKIYGSAKKLHTAFKALTENLGAIINGLKASLGEIEVGEITILDKEIEIKLSAKGEKYIATVGVREGENDGDLDIRSDEEPQLLAEVSPPMAQTTAGAAGDALIEVTGAGATGSQVSEEKLKQALTEAGGHQKSAASKLGISQSHMSKIIHEYGLRGFVRGLKDRSLAVKAVARAKAPPKAKENGDPRRLGHEEILYDGQKISSTMFEHVKKFSVVYDGLCFSNPPLPVSRAIIAEKMGVSYETVSVILRIYFSIVDIWREKNHLLPVIHNALKLPRGTAHNQKTGDKLVKEGFIIYVKHILDVKGIDIDDMEEPDFDLNPHTKDRLIGKDGFFKTWEIAKEYFKKAVPRHVAQPTQEGILKISIEQALSKLKEAMNTGKDFGKLRIRKDFLKALALRPKRIRKGAGDIVDIFSTHKNNAERQEILGLIKQHNSPEAAAALYWILIEQDRNADISYDLAEKIIQSLGEMAKDSPGLAIKYLSDIRNKGRRINEGYRYQAIKALAESGKDVAFSHICFAVSGPLRDPNWVVRDLAIEELEKCPQSVVVKARETLIEAFKEELLGAIQKDAKKALIRGIEKTYKKLKGPQEIIDGLKTEYAQDLKRLQTTEERIAARENTNEAEEDIKAGEEEAVVEHAPEIDVETDILLSTIPEPPPDEGEPFEEDASLAGAAGTELLELNFTQTRIAESDPKIKQMWQYIEGSGIALGEEKLGGVQYICAELLDNLASHAEHNGAVDIKLIVKDTQKDMTDLYLEIVYSDDLAEPFKIPVVQAVEDMWATTDTLRWRGLGLPMCRMLTKQLGGEFYVIANQKAETGKTEGVDYYYYPNPENSEEYKSGFYKTDPVSKTEMKIKVFLGQITPQQLEDLKFKVFDLDDNKAGINEIEQAERDIAAETADAQATGNAVQAKRSILIVERIYCLIGSNNAISETEIAINELELPGIEIDVKAVDNKYNDKHMEYIGCMERYIHGYDFVLVSLLDEQGKGKYVLIGPKMKKVIEPNRLKEELKECL